MSHLTKFTNRVIHPRATSGYVIFFTKMKVVLIYCLKKSGGVDITYLELTTIHIVIIY